MFDNFQIISDYYYLYFCFEIKKNFACRKLTHFVTHYMFYDHNILEYLVIISNVSCNKAAKRHGFDGW